MIRVLCFVFLAATVSLISTSPAQADLLGIRNQQLKTIRVIERGSRHGHPSDQLNVEVVIAFEGREGDFGFQLRDDANLPVREGMLSLLQDAFNHGHNVNIDYEVDPPKKNGVILRVWLTRAPRVNVPAGAITGAGARVDPALGVVTDTQD